MTTPRTPSAKPARSGDRPPSRRAVVRRVAAGEGAEPVRAEAEPVAAAPAIDVAEPVAAAPEVQAAEPAAAAPETPVAEPAAAAPETPVAEPVVEAPAPPVPAPPASTAPLPPPLPMVTKMNTATPFKGYDELTAFNKANLDAFIQANAVLAKGFEEISREVLGLAQASFESATAATKAILAAKTLKDVVELNADFTKSQYETLVANSTKLGEMAVKLATETAAPISARVTHAVDTVTRPTA